VSRLARSMLLPGSTRWEYASPGESTRREYASPRESTHQEYRYASPRNQTKFFKPTPREKHTPGELTPREEHTPCESTPREKHTPGKSTRREKHTPGKWTRREEHTPGGSLQNRFLPRFRIYMQKAIFTPNQGPRSKIMSEKNQGQKSCVSVLLSTRISVRSHVLEYLYRYFLKMELILSLAKK